MVEGKIIVLTGTFNTMKRTEAAESLKRMGAKIGSGISKKTDILFAGERAGSKLKKAENLGICVMSESDLLAILAGGSKNEGTEESKILETPAIKSKADKSKSTSPSSVPKSSVNTILPYWTEISYEEPKDNFNEALLEQFGIKPESKIRNTFH